MHLFEFGDQNFVPDFYHEFLRDFMGQLYKKLGHYKLWTDSFSKFCERNRSGIIHDPCAGSGEINELLIRELPNFQDYKFLLSDLIKHIPFQLDTNGIEFKASHSITSSD